VKSEIKADTVVVVAALNTTEFNVEELVSAIRKAAKELGCYESEERFQEYSLQLVGTNQ
jgi:hypothetical protein